jgi:hypothetical protein
MDCVYTIITLSFFCNPNPQYQTTVEESINFELPPPPSLEDVEEVELEQESTDNALQTLHSGMVAW